MAEINCKSINPSSEKIIAKYNYTSPQEILETIDKSYEAQRTLSSTPVSFRTNLFQKISSELRSNIKPYATLMSEEMGKIFSQGVAEVEKCAFLCEHYSEHGEKFLKPSYPIFGDLHRHVEYYPLGIVFGIMPWNFPFLQAFRYIIPAILGGNTALLKHASNVTGCALAIEEIFVKLSSIPDIVKVLKLPSSSVPAIIADPRISAVTLTGSENAGRSVAEHAGKNLKKVVLELGGSDPFIVFEDSNLDMVTDKAVQARLINNGQTCIAAKRILVSEKIYDQFILTLSEKIKNIVIGDPLAAETQLGPLAKVEICDELESLVNKSIKQGAKVVVKGGRIKDKDGFFFLPCLLTDITPAHAVFNEETFGPVFSVSKFKDDDEACHLANLSRFGLGSSIWTNNEKRIKRFSVELQAGMVFVNEVVRSDPRLPFGGVKCSGFGRELGEFGVKEFLNAKTIVQG